MPQPADTFSTYGQIGIREDLVDIIYDVSPVETPFVSLVPRVAATNTLHEWQTDVLDPAANNAVIEGDDATTDAATPTVRLGNTTQISDKVARVTGTARAVNTAGRADELDYQMLKRGKELRRDMETVCLSNKAKVVGTDAVAREAAGVPSWIFTNSNAAGDATAPTGDGSDAWDEGTPRAYDEAFVKEVMRKAYDAGGSPDVMMVGGFNRQIASSFGPGTKFQKLEDKTLHTSFDVYESDFGELRIIPNRFQDLSMSLLLQTDMWAIGFVAGRNMAVLPLAKTGDSDRRQILSEYTVEARNEKSSGIIVGLTVA